MKIKSIQPIMPLFQQHINQSINQLSLITKQNKTTNHQSQSINQSDLCGISFVTFKHFMLNITMSILINRNTMKLNNNHSFSLYSSC